MARLTATQEKFYEKVIINSIDSDGYDENPKGTKAKLQFLKNTFKSEYGFNISRMGEQRAFSEWLQGLPSAMSIPFYNVDIIKLAKKSGTLSKNPTEREEDKILENYWNFMTAKTFKAFRKYKIN
jgi:hypothetical protein